MLSYYLKCRNNTESKNLNALKIKMEECFYQNLLCGRVKNWNLSKSKKLADYKVA